MTRSVVIIGGQWDQHNAALNRWSGLGWDVLMPGSYRDIVSADSVALFDASVDPMNPDLRRLCIAIAQYRGIPIYRADSPGAPLVVPQVLLTDAKPERVQTHCVDDDPERPYREWQRRLSGLPFQCHYPQADGVPCASPLDMQRAAGAEVTDGSEGTEG